MMVLLSFLVATTPVFDWPGQPGGVYLHVLDDGYDLTLERGVSTSLLPGTASYFWGYSDPVSGSEFAAWSTIDNRYDMAAWASNGDYLDQSGEFSGTGWDVTSVPEPAILSAGALAFFCLRRSSAIISH